MDKYHLLSPWSARQRPSVWHKPIPELKYDVFIHQQLYSSYVEWSELPQKTTR